MYKEINNEHSISVARERSVIGVVDFSRCQHVRMECDHRTIRPTDACSKALLQKIGIIS